MGLFAPFFVYAGETKIIAIEGMTCPACAVAVESALKGLSEVESVKISMSDNKAFVTSKKGKELSVEQIETTINKVGFKVKSIGQTK